MIGKTLGNYQIIEELGRGGMAVVYRAYQPSLNRYVAIKVLPPQLSFDQQFVERFQREARAAAGLRHPNIVVIHDVGQQEGTYYIVMEYLEGRTLKQVIEQDGPLPPARVAHIIAQVAAALDYAHGQGFVHRDVKPANIFVGKGDHVTLTDFGIAKAASETQHLTRTGMLMGTPEYMSPEQAESGVVDHRTDLYALGVVLYQMLVGRVPFRGTTPHAVLHSVIYEPPPPPRQINPNLSPAVEAVILRTMAKRPEERFQRGAELAAALRSALAGKAPAPGRLRDSTPERRRDSTVPPPQPPTPRRGVRPRNGFGTPPRDGVGTAPSPVARQRRSPSVLWIMAGIAGVLVLMLGYLVLELARGGAGKTPSGAPTTQAAIGMVPTAGATPTGSFATTLPPPTPSEVSPATAIPPESPTPGTTSGLRDTATPPPDTESPTASATPTPTASATPTPTASATASATASVPPPPPPCAFDAQGLFAGLWQAYKDRLGCPLYQTPKPIQDAEQAFDNGHMFWRQDNDYAYVVYEKGGLAGTYQGFTDMWTEGDPEYSCVASPPPGKVQPKRGFGAVWCELGGPGAAIGWGLGEEAGFGPGYGDPLVQDFERGFIFRDSDGTAQGMAYVFLGSQGTFVRLSY